MRPFVLFTEYFVISLSGFCLLMFNVIDDGYKIHVLSATFLASAFPVTLRVFYTKKWDWHGLGFRFDNLKESLGLYLKLTTLGILVLLTYAFVFDTFTKVNISTLLFYSFWGAIAQELLYRAYLIKLGQDLFGEGKLNIVVNVIIFVGMHAFYPDFVRKLWVLVPAGILFTVAYREKPNIILVSSSHVILNFTAVMLGIFH